MPVEASAASAHREGYRRGGSDTFRRDAAGTR